MPNQIVTTNLEVASGTALVVPSDGYQTQINQGVIVSTGNGNAVEMQGTPAGGAGWAVLTNEGQIFTTNGMAAVNATPDHCLIGNDGLIRGAPNQYSLILTGLHTTLYNQATGKIIGNISSDGATIHNTGSITGNVVSQADAEEEVHNAGSSSAT